MHIWVDADATPVAVKEVLFKAAQRRQLATTLVANQALRVPRSPYIKAIQVGAGFDVADNYIVQQAQPGDLVITQDIPLAAEVIAKGALVINNRGEQYDGDNIRQRLGMRNFMEELRSSGQITGGPAPFSAADKQQFANALDRLVTRLLK